uniref:Uncharacterized protein n=1 Tax=Nelumbo nucifera TaxID=4432 RepID=A0A822YEW8_NELNU|nr:TPA_asm: hypothetical protein HUJ06_031034 [Nelumbo nucifera]
MVKHGNRIIVEFEGKLKDNTINFGKLSFAVIHRQKRLHRL